MKFSSDVKFKFGDFVYLKTDPDKEPRIVTCMQFTISSVLYGVNYMETMSFHYDFEIDFVS